MSSRFPKRPKVRGLSALKRRRTVRGAPPRELEKAAMLFRDFRERGLGQVKRRKVDWPRVTVAIGRVVEIVYDTAHGARPVRYRHTFKEWARPEFNASADGKLLLILPGNFVFTERGIVDRRQRDE